MKKKIEPLTEEEKEGLNFLASRHSKGFSEPFTYEEINRYFRVHNKNKINKNLKQAVTYYNRTISGYTNESIHMIG